MLDEEAVEECFDVDNNVPVVLQLKGSKIVNIIMHLDRGSNAYDGNEVLMERKKF